MMLKGDRIDGMQCLLRRNYRKDKRYVDRFTGLPTSRAFAPSPKDDGKLSVNIKSLTTYAATIENEQKYKLFEIMASLVYKLNLDCTYDPIPPDDPILPENLAHAIIVGFDPEDESIPGILARSAREVTAETWDKAKE